MVAATRPPSPRSVALGWLVAFAAGCAVGAVPVLLVAAGDADLPAEGRLRDPVPDGAAPPSSHPDGAEVPVLGHLPDRAVVEWVLAGDVPIDVEAWEADCATACAEGGIDVVAADAVADGETVLLLRCRVEARGSSDAPLTAVSLAAGVLGRVGSDTWCPFALWTGSEPLASADPAAIRAVYRRLCGRMAAFLGRLKAEG